MKHPPPYNRFGQLRRRIRRSILPQSPSSSSIPFWEYAKWLRFTRLTPKHPHSIDIQTKSGCNANCSFCPVGQENNKIPGTMSDDLFQKIIDEVLQFPSLRQINPYLLNDPLVDEALPERIEYIGRKRRPSRKPIIRIITNAGLLSQDMGYRLLHAGALDEMIFSFHSIIPSVFETMMPPLKFDRVMANIIRFKQQWDRYRGKKPKLAVWTVKTKPVADNLENEKAYWKKLGIGFKARSMDNRANTEIEKREGLSHEPFDRVLVCAVPFWRSWVMWNGDMIMCCVDQERSYLLGNCREQSIHEIWNSDLYHQLRERWRSGHLSGLLCENCKGT